MHRLALGLSSLILLHCGGVAPLPKQAIDLNDRGAAALAAGDLEVADARLSLALEYSPRFVDALVNLGLVECQRGNFARARQLLTRARRVNPDVAQPHHGLGVLAELERRPDLASEHYLDALRVDPGFAPARGNLGRLQFEAGQLDAATLTFKKLSEVAPDDPRGLVGLGETLLRLGRYAEAQATAARAARRFPDEPTLSLLGARVALHARDFGLAERTLSPLAARRDEFGAAALAWLATLELARGEPRRAVGAAERALRLDPEQPVAVHALSLALSELGDPTAPAWRARSLELLSARHPSESE